jgi:hypothetical protein
LAVHRLAFALTVWAIRATLNWTFIERYATPPKGFHDVFFGTGHIAGLVSILDAEDEITSHFFAKR